MDGEASFPELMRQVRTGDEQAAAKLVRQYESFIRREVRLRLEDRRLCRLFDSMDVCQSVLASFFVRAAAGQYELDRPDQLVRLLVTMARNKLASAARRHRSEKRDHRRATAGEPEQLAAMPGADGTPSEIVANRELLQRVQGELQEEEQRIADLRSQGRAWEQVAKEMGGTAQARRVQFSRAMDRIVKRLGLEEDSDA